MKTDTIDFVITFIGLSLLAFIVVGLPVAIIMRDFLGWI